MRHARRALHQIGHASLEYIRHALSTGHLMGQNSGRTLASGSTHFAHPYADPFGHVARRKLKPLVSPIRLPSGVVATRLTIAAVTIPADVLAVFPAYA